MGSVVTEFRVFIITLYVVSAVIDIRDENNKTQ